MLLGCVADEKMELHGMNRNEVYLESRWVVSGTGGRKRDIEKRENTKDNYRTIK